ncbi:uncharacterized protein THITE_2109331 [Thermothielavioides terrestris NRRL 8126]|uniref:Polymerase nucleotidyl transferase domain-containing protein n=1 Tax=Thermothielavioides terrestris (strain ATCC 38088 / NRRL 8126) TaxID=578455 RepID=G2QUU8_THETT|nr:uncharacterized protein THITE_2109331 [Thermothielavioides terrestris NRRL 8126]AEO63743.1 hypothetical protein THITE_2109331 [Thermothielavioides terrestris NRRL 8126]
MYPHHEQTIQNIKAHLQQDPRVQALILGGSIAHGFENPASDVDVLIVLSEDDYNAQLETGYSTYRNVEAAPYPGGYVDGKYITLSFIRQVAERGSEPWRYAFDGAQVLFSRIPGLEDEIKRAATYPVGEKTDRVKRFRTQLAAWHWFSIEARKKNNKYLLNVAVSKLVLFGSRLILAHNETLYPFHKWLLAVLERVPEKPEGFVSAIERLNEDRSEENVQEFFEMVKQFRNWDETMLPDGWERWGSQYAQDVELTWLNGNRAIDDL